MTKRLASFVLAVLASAVFAQAAAHPVQIRDFDARTFAALRAQYAGRPFVLAFWSMYCEPCRKEMAQWGPLQRRHPDVPIVLVATDPPAERAMIEKALVRYDLTGVETYAYADDFEERVRFAVDRTWRGELPRTYLIDADQHMTSRSGPADLQWIEPWLGRKGAAAR